MAATLEELEKRVRDLEAEVQTWPSVMRELWARAERDSATACSSERGARLLAAALADRAGPTASWETIDLRVEPIGVERLRAMLLSEGIKPEDNMLSREITRLREV